MGLSSSAVVMQIAVYGLHSEMTTPASDGVYGGLERSNYSKATGCLLLDSRLGNLSPAGVLTPDADKDSALGDDTH